MTTSKPIKNQIDILWEQIADNKKRRTAEEKGNEPDREIGPATRLANANETQKSLERVILNNMQHFEEMSRSKANVSAFTPSQSR